MIKNLLLLLLLAAAMVQPVAAQETPSVEIRKGVVYKEGIPLFKLEKIKKGGFFGDPVYLVKNNNNESLITFKSTTLQLPFGRENLLGWRTLFIAGTNDSIEINRKEIDEGVMNRKLESSLVAYVIDHNLIRDNKVDETAVTTLRAAHRTSLSDQYRMEASLQKNCIENRKKLTPGRHIGQLTATLTKTTPGTNPENATWYYDISLDGKVVARAEAEGRITALEKQGEAYMLAGIANPDGGSGLTYHFYSADGCYLGYVPYKERKVYSYLNTLVYFNYPELFKRYEEEMNYILNETRNDDFFRSKEDFVCYIIWAMVENNLF